jgi:hypothetical protein
MGKENTEGKPTERKVEYGGTWLGWGPSDYLCWFISPGTTIMI